jgi:hypothetical protein
MKICPLCKIDPATKTECHIFPRFLGLSMRIDGNQSRVFRLNEDFILGKTIYNQDTAKEDYLLCPKCESFLDHELETHVAEKFYNVRSDNKYYIKSQINSDVFYYTYKDLDQQKFKRLIYSMIFRASIASIYPYSDFKITEEQEDYFAKQILGTDFFIDCTMYVFIQTQNQERKPNIMCIKRFDQDPDIYQIFANEIMIIVDPINHLVSRNDFLKFKSETNQLIRFFEVPDNVWIELIKTTMIRSMNQMLKNKIEYILGLLINRQNNK